MFEVGLEGRLGLLLQVKQVIVHLFRVEIGGQFAIIQYNGCYVSGVTPEGLAAAFRHRNHALKTVQ